MYLSILIKKKIKESDVKVLLVGEGGDEVLSGYRRFIYPYLYDIRSKLNKIDFEKVLKKAENFLEIKKELIIENFEKFQKEYFSSNSQQENQSAYPILSKSFNEEYLSLKKKPTYLKTSKNNETILSLFLYNHIFIRDLPNILKMEDSNSMANSIESRVPFLDHKFVEYCVSHNTEEFMKNGENKAMLRQAMGKILPKSILSRKSKSGRPGNDNFLMYNILYDEMCNILSSLEFKGLNFSTKIFYQHFTMTKSLIIKKEARFGLGYIVYVNGGCLISNEYFLIF